MVLVGKILKSLRLKGELKCTFEPFFIPDGFKADVFFIGKESSVLPYFPLKIDKLADHIAGIAFEDLESKEEADKLNGLYIWMKAEEFEKSGLKSMDIFEEEYGFQGYQVIDSNAGDLGIISAVYEASHHVVADCIKEDKVLMIPLHQDLITKVDHENKTIYTEYPEGLTDL